MTPEDQAAIREAGRLATLEERRLAAAQDSDSLKQLLSHDVQFTELTTEQRDAFRKATAPVYEKVRDTVGSEIYDKFIAAIDTADSK
jgi:TRAP-type C4-dicarboxylate transport system substrate-binding protein